MLSAYTLKHSNWLAESSLFVSREFKYIFNTYILGVYYWDNVIACTFTN